MQLLLLFYAVYVAAGGRSSICAGCNLQLQKIFGCSFRNRNRNRPIPVSETASRAVDRLDGETPLFHIKGKGGYLSNF